MNMPHKESGNVLFYILIAVAMLAALSFAVSQGSRGSGQTISAERAKLLASEIIEYSNDICTAASQIKLRGIDDTELCFDHTSWGANDYDHAGCTDDFNKIFHITGAGLTWKNAPSEAMDSNATPDNLYHIYGDNAVEDIGTTCASASCSDLILVVDELQEIICQHINALLDITDVSAPPPTDTDIGKTRYIGAYGYTATIGDEVGGTALIGKSSGCFLNTTDSKYTFYKVLIAR